MAITRLGGANAISGTIPAANVATLTSSNLPTGSVLQVQSTFYNTSFSQSLTSNTKTAINNLNVNITPSSTSSKIFLFGRAVNELSTTSNHDLTFFFLRNSTAINIGAASGSRRTGMISAFQNYRGADANSTPDPLNMFTIDTPSTTSQITYHIGVEHTLNATLYVNRTVVDSDSVGYERLSAEIIAMEIKG